MICHCSLEHSENIPALYLIIAGNLGLTTVWQVRIQTGLSGLYKPVRFFRDGSTLNNSHNIFILNLNQFYCLLLFQ